MSKAFAEKIIDSMVDENGNCGERGLSERQFDILAEHLEPEEDWQQDGAWQGQYKKVWFEHRDWAGNIGKYFVRLQERSHFRMGYNVVSIELRDEDEYKAELEAEAKAEAERKRKRELLSFPNSQHQFDIKQRVELTLTLLRDYQYEGYSYSYYDSALSHIYTFTDDEGNCFVWKTKNWIVQEGETSLGDIVAQEGDKVTMRATVKEHGEYRGIKQTVLTRCLVKTVEKAQ